MRRVEISLEEKRREEKSSKEENEVMRGGRLMLLCHNRPIMEVLRNVN